MKLFKKKIKVEEKPNTNLPVESYDKTYETSPLKLLVIIVNRHQGEYYLDMILKKCGVSAGFLCNGKGTGTRDIYNLLNISENKKDVVLAVIREDKKSEIFKYINDRFNISKNAKGIAFTIKVNSVMGVLLYRFLSDTKQNIRKGWLWAIV